MYEYASLIQNSNYKSYIGKIVLFPIVGLHCSVVCFGLLEKCVSPHKNNAAAVTGISDGIQWQKDLKNKQVWKAYQAVKHCTAGIYN